MLAKWVEIIYYFSPNSGQQWTLALTLKVFAKTAPPPTAMIMISYWALKASQTSYYKYTHLLNILDISAFLG